MSGDPVTVERMQVIVTRAAPRQAQAIHELRLAAEAWLAERGVRQWVAGEVTLEEIRRQVRRGQWQVAVERDTVCAAVRLLWSDPDVWQADNGFAAYVHGLMVDRRYAGIRLGARLIGWVEGQARRAQAPALRLDCVEGNGWLRRYYAGLGFQEVGRRSFEGGWHPVVLLEKRLIPPG